MTSLTSRDSRVDVARQRHVDDQQRTPAAARHHHLDGRPFDEHLRGRGRRQQDICVDERVGNFAERDGFAADALRGLLGASEGAVRDPDAVDAARPQRRGEARAHLARADHEDLCSVERAEVLGGDGHGRRRDRNGMPADAGLRAHPLARLDGVAEQSRELRRGALAHGGLPGLADLAEDLALADDHRVEAGGDGEQVRDGRVVVIGVEQVGEIFGRGARVRGEERADVTDRGVEVRAARVDLDAIAGGEHHDLEQVLACAEVVEHLRKLLLRHRHPLEQVDRRRAVVEADHDQRHEFKSSFASATRPARTRSTMPESKARCQSASSLERPDARIASRASERSSSRVSYSGPSSSVRNRRRYAASAGLRPPVPTATTRSARRITDIIVKAQFAGSSALLTQTRRRLAGREDRRVDRRVVGRGECEPGAVEVVGTELPLDQLAATGIDPAPHLRSDDRRDHDDLGAEVEQRLDLAGRDPTATHDHDPAIAHDQVDRQTGEPGAPGGHRCITRPSRPTGDRGRPHGAVGRTTGSAARSRGRPCGSTRRWARSSTAGAKLRIERTPASTSSSATSWATGAGVAIMPIVILRSSTMPASVGDRLDRQLARPRRPTRSWSASTSATIRKPRAPKPR